MVDGLAWLLARLAGGIVDLARLPFNEAIWTGIGDWPWLIRLMHYGASPDLLFAVLVLAIVLLVVGLLRRPVLWAVVRGIEALNNTIGRLAAWAALIMVVQQVMIVVLQRIFRVSEITIGPSGYVFTRDLSWFGEELKLYNAMIVCLCAAWTFVQSGHVRVDLLYAGASWRGRRVVDMAGSMLFVLPLATVIWLFGWSFLWRSLVTPKIAATDTLDQLLSREALFKWNVETIGFSPNGFDGYFLFKVVLVAFAGLMFLQGFAFFYRCLLELIEGPQSEARYHDPDSRLAGAPAS